jgi:hypothetical protein
MVNPPGYERRDANVRVLSYLLAGLLGVTLIAMLLMIPLFRHFAAVEARHQPPPSTLAGARPQLPPEPRLEPMPFDELRRVRARGQELLDSYGWVDRKEGIVRIPIERAIDLTAERGLPADENGKPAPDRQGEGR